MNEIHVSARLVLLPVWHPLFWSEVCPTNWRHQLQRWGRKQNPSYYALIFFFFSFKSVLVLLELVVKREGSSDGDGAVRRRQQRSAPGTRLPGDPRGNPAARSWKLLPAAAACPPGSVVSAPWAPGGALRAGTSRGCPGRGRPRAAPGGSAAPGAAPGPLPEGLRGFGPGWAQEPLPLDRPRESQQAAGSRCEAFNSAWV